MRSQRVGQEPAVAAGRPSNYGGSEGSGGPHTWGLWGRYV